MRPGTALLLLLLAAGLPAAASAAPKDDGPGAGLRLRESRIVAAPSAPGRFQVRARIALRTHAGDLGEGARYTVLGRFAKGGQACSAHALFRNGFEGG